MEVTIGKEKHKFVEGPFTTFGTQVLEQVGPQVFPLVSLSFPHLHSIVFSIEEGKIQKGRQRSSLLVRECI